MKMKVGQPPSDENQSLSKWGAPGDQPDTVRVNFDLEREKHVRLKVHAARTGRSVADILRELVDGLED